jgi:hypothetical protein
MLVIDARARAQELIRELDWRARTNTLVGVMLFRPPELVWSCEVNRVQRLESLIRDGARPFGLFGLTEFRTNYLFWVEPLPEDEDNPEIWHILLRLLADVNNRARRFKVRVGGKKVGY